MSKAITSAVTKLLSFYDAQDVRAEELLNSLAGEVEGSTRAEVSALITPAIGAYYKCATPEGGLDRESKSYEAAKKRRQRILGGLFQAGDKPSKQASSVDKAVRAFEALSSAERKKFLRLIGQA